MVPELGHFSLILALGLSLALAVLPAVGVVRRIPVLMATGGSLAWGIFAMLLFSFCCLVFAFVNDDFSVRYVAANSNTALPIYYKISALWGAHEGSFLLWTLIMATWTLAVACFSGGLTPDMRARVLAVMGLLTTGFVLFILFTSNPFDRILPFYPQDGADLNPLLQDLGLIVHPPMLYMGYVGFAVPFAFAIATLTAGRLDAAWARWSRPWTNAAWAFLTIGITLGSWWAYYELGWGGWWFWDAVENASFMPWLAGTALVHSLAVSEKRGVFKSWTLLLAITTFALSLLGAFLVRSGVLTSVHAFAVDPARGMFILIFLVLVVGGSLLLYAVKARGISSAAQYRWSSREALLLGNNVLLVVAAAAVLLGTLYPLLYEVATGGGKISVGPPYFNAVFVPVVSLLFVIMVFGPGSRWKQADLMRLVHRELPALVVAVVIVVGLTLWLSAPLSLVGTTLESIAVWILLTLGWHGWQQGRQPGRKVFALSSAIPSASYLGMLVAHAGIALAILGVSVTTAFSEGKDVRMSPGDVVSLYGYDFTFKGVTGVQGPNYVADRAEVSVSRAGQVEATLYPEKRYYNVTGSVMTEADMDPTLFRDLYVALGEQVSESAWAVRLHVKPLVRWIWFGGLMIAVGGFITLVDRRYRRTRAAVS